MYGHVSTTSFQSKPLPLVTFAGTAAASSNRGGGTQTADGSNGEQQQQVPHRLPVHVGQQCRQRQPGPKDMLRRYGSRGFARCSVVRKTAELQLSGASGQSLKAGFCSQRRPRRLIAEQSRAGLRWKKKIRTEYKSRQAQCGVPCTSDTHSERMASLSVSQRWQHVRLPPPWACFREHSLRSTLGRSGCEHAMSATNSRPTAASKQNKNLGT
jgi:hypothetical protein